MYDYGLLLYSIYFYFKTELQSDKGTRKSTKRLRVRSEINPAFSLSTVSQSIGDVAGHTEVYTDGTNVIASTPFKKEFATLQDRTDSKGHTCQNQAMDLNLNCICSTNSDNSSQGIHDVSHDIQLSPITKPRHKENILSSKLDQESNIRNNVRAVDETVSVYNSLNIYGAADIADILDETQYIETDLSKTKDGIQQQIYSVINISDTTICASHIDYSATDIVNVLDIISEKETIYDKPNNMPLIQRTCTPLVHAHDMNDTGECNYLDNQSTCSHSKISNTVVEHMIVRSSSFPSFKRYTIFTSKNIDDSMSEFTRKHTRRHSFTSEKCMSERVLSNNKSVDFLKISTLPKNCIKNEFMLKSSQTNESTSLSEVEFDNNEMKERSNKSYNYTPSDSDYVDEPLHINTHIMLLNNDSIGYADEQLDINTHTNLLKNESLNIQDTSKTEHVEINGMQSDSKQSVDRDSNQSFLGEKGDKNDNTRAVLVEQSKDNEEYFDASDIMELSSKDGNNQSCSTLHSRLPYLNTEV